MGDFLEGFTEYRGRTDLDKVACPHCGATFYLGRPADPPAGWSEELTCSSCDGDFIVMVTTTPLGKAWQTWDKDPKPQP